MPARFAEDVITDNDRSNPQNFSGQYDQYLSLNNEVVISGFSGRVPECSNVEEFKRKLYDGVDLVTDDPRRWEKGLYGLPERVGKIKAEDMEVFDQQFFSVSAKQAECMDPQMRMLLEATYEAIVDGGVNPMDIRGSRTGVYVGVSSSETEDYWIEEADRVNGYGLTGCCRAMFANRVSYAFDFKGPSYAVDTACSSSLYALSLAFTDIRLGRCERAIVAGTNLILKPEMSLQFKRLSMLSDNGMCKAFDATGSGYVRSDGIAVLFLQRASLAKRVYASLLNARTNTDGFKEQGITYPDGQMQNRLIRETYEEINLDPNEVVYMECHGTGTKVGDPQEVNSIADYFCKNRKTPLLIGSVKSNMGHSEAASGVCSIMKMLIAMEEGVIPGNLHFTEPNPDLYGLRDGHLKVVDRNTEWNGGIIGVNSFGFGGANAHVVLKSNPKPKTITPRDSPPKLVICSGRTMDAVQDLLEDAAEHRDDDEYLSLINGIYIHPVPLHFYRGYDVLTSKGSVKREVFEYSDEKRPIWFIYSGMGSQWPSMAKDLLHFDVINKSIHRCAEILRPEGIDVIDILTRSTEEKFTDIVSSFVSITTMQVALTDLLSSLGIHPDGIVGHSVGELGCAYADGGLTADQAVLATYYRGRAIKESNLPKGKMAAVGLSWDDAHKRVPADCYPVCHNNQDNCTVAGPGSSIDTLVQKLNSEGVFAKAVSSAGFAFHSKYIAGAAPKLRQFLEKVIPTAKNRTQRWISSSIPESAWNTPVAKQSSAAYHVNNMLSPVLFYEALLHIPSNAICIEISPHGLLQAILKRALGREALNISLVKRGHQNNAEFLLTNIGKLFAAGGQPQIQNLARPITYPVGRGTPMLNSKVGWDHSQRWHVTKFGVAKSSGDTVVDIDLSGEDDAFLMGHNIDGRILFPATGYMTLAWMTFAKMRGVEFNKAAVVMEDLVFHRATIMNKDNVAKFGINFFDGTGAFEICEGGSLAMSGKIKFVDNITHEELPLEPLTPNNVARELVTNDVYKELRLRGYDYSGIFRGILTSDITARTGKLQWVDNWISFIDTMLQFSLLSRDLRELYLPTRIEKAVINPAKHLEILSQFSEEDLKTVGIPVYMYSDINVMKSGGVELRGLKASLAQRRPNAQKPPMLEHYTFVPNSNQSELQDNSAKTESHALSIAIQLVIENSERSHKIKGVELAGGRNADSLVAGKLVQIIENEPTTSADIAVATSNTDEESIKTAFNDFGVRVVSKNISKTAVEQNCHFLYGSDILSRPDTAVLENSIASIKENGFLIFDESLSSYKKYGCSVLSKYGFICVQELNSGDSRIIIIARRSTDLSKRKSVIINITEKNYDWLEELKSALASAAEEEKYIYIVCQGEELFGSIGFTTCLTNEHGGKFVRSIIIQDKNAEKFSLSSPFYQQQLVKDLTLIILKGGTWGTFRHLKLEREQGTLQVEHAYVNALVKGDLASLKWIEASPSQVPKSSDLEMCTVYYAPVNFRDVMLSSGKLSADALPGDLAQHDCVLGLEFSGRNSAGKRIMALVSAKSLATTCLADKRMMWEVPSNWTMEEASTVPAVYSTVYYALVVRGEMKKGETILIHAGSGGVGQAAISVALHHGLTVFTTVGSREKRDFLKKRFPQLQDRNIGNSRDTSFEQLIMKETQGKGVDLVLNSLSEEKLQASVRCLGLNGRFLEIGKFDLSNNSPLGMSVFLKNTTFHGILLDSVMEGEDEMQARVVSLVSEGIKAGAVRPLPTTVFNELQVEQAFRFMASGKHIGKVVIKVRDEEPGKKTLKPTSRLVNAIPRSYMHPEKSYIIIGGLGGFGLEMTHWMVSRGAKYIVLNSRSGIKTGYQTLMVRRWQERDVKVIVDTNDATTDEGCKKLLQNANKLALVGGIFNLAAVLRDAFIEDLTPQDYEIVCKPKSGLTKLLDVLSRSLCPELDYFVCFSSASCGRGNGGQTNYGIANSGMERICEHRRAEGLPGLAIQWGAVGDTGLVIEGMGDNDTVIGGTLPQRMSSCLQTLDFFIQQPHPVVSSMVLADKRNTDASGGVSLVAAVANILGLRDIKNVQDGATLADLGMDSLMSSEIKQTLERCFDIVMSPQEIRTLTFGHLKELDSGRADRPVSAATSSATSSATSTPTRTPTPIGDGTQVVFVTELMPSEAIIRMETAAPPNSNKRPIFFISPIEGFIDALKGAAERLDCPVYGLQCTADVDLETIETMAKFYVKHIRKVQPKGPYSIAGYSFGATVAFAMAVELEQNKEIVKLVLLDGAPKYVNWYTQTFKKRYNTSDDEDQNQAFALAYFGVVAANTDFSMAKSLAEIPTFEGKVEKCAEIVAAEIDRPIELIKTAAALFYHKLRASDQYAVTHHIKCDVTLIKPTENYSKLEVDYGLSEVCDGKVNVLIVEGNHRTMLMEEESLQTIEATLKKMLY